MIEHVNGNLLQADAEALVNTVNTVGVMGKGIALQFRQAYPDNFNVYQAACKHGDVQPGHMLVFETGWLTNPRYIINFPTKRHWKGRSRMEDIAAGLRALIAEVRQRGIRSIAVPPLGCGNGGLDWNEVRPQIETAFADVPDVHVLLYAPEGAPLADEMRVNTTRPNMTPGRAAIISLLKQYALPGYRATMLEIEKLAYVLQAAGQPLNLAFEKGQYGPYVETLHHVLQRMEGHFIRGYGDRSARASIHLLGGADSAAEDFLADDLETQERLQRVAALIEGFETPYGLELLTTIHWLALHEDAAIAFDIEATIRRVHAWNERKQRFRPEHIRVAWQRLYDQGWFAVGENALCAA